jgi:ATP-dependent Clp protease ATP-binding subunit ClpA
MNDPNFTTRVRIVLQMAREEAARLHHEYVGTEHILLALIDEEEGVALAVLTNLNMDLEEIRRKIEETVKTGKAGAAAGPDLPYASRAKKVLEFAMSEARELNFDNVGTEHLLIGLLREEKGIAAQVLTDAGLTIEATRKEMLRLLAGMKVGGSPRTVVSGERDQRFKTAIGLIELHHVRFGSYPNSLDDLQFLGGRDRVALAGVRYEKLRDGYALDMISGEGSTPDLSYPSDFWHGLGLRRTNVGRDPGT